MIVSVAFSPIPGTAGTCAISTVHLLDSVIKVEIEVSYSVENITYRDKWDIPEKVEPDAKRHQRKRKESSRNCEERFWQQRLDWKLVIH